MAVIGIHHVGLPVCDSPLNDDNDEESDEDTIGWLENIIM